MHIVILPAGAWGTALAMHVQRLGHVVTLLPRTEEEALEMTTSRENRPFFAGHRLDRSIQIGWQYGPALLEAELLILSSPMAYLRGVCRELRPHLAGSRILRMAVCLSKGLETGTNAMPAEVIDAELGGLPTAILSGPSFASQVAEGEPTAVVLASRAAPELVAEIQRSLSGGQFRVYTSDDVRGVGLGGSLKNVYAIASGICDGLGFRDNTKAALLTRSLAEMVRLGVAMGGRMETFYGLSGLGDLVLTCNGQESRNRSFGELFARGTSVESLLKEKGMTVEGYKTCANFHALCVEQGLDAPILNEIHAILFEGRAAAEALRSLMGRELKPEHRRS